MSNNRGYQRVSSVLFDGMAASSDAIKGAGLATTAVFPEAAPFGVSLAAIGVAVDTFQGYAENYYESEGFLDVNSRGQYRSLPGVEQYHDLYHRLWKDDTKESIL